MKPSMKPRTTEPAPAAQPNEGEGNRTAARAYDEAATRHARRGTKEQAHAAARAHDDPRERSEMERAERAGKERIAEEDRALRDRSAETRPGRR